MKPRPLVIRFGALGDMILLTSLLRGLHDTWGEPCDLIVPARAVSGIFDGLETVGEIHGIRSRRSPYSLSPDQWRLVRHLRKMPPAPVFIADRIHRTAPVDRLLARAGVPPSHIVGPQEAQRGDLEHVVHYFGRLRRLCPAPFAGSERQALSPRYPIPELRVDSTEVLECTTWLRSKGWIHEPLIFFQTQSRRSKRGRWALANWVETISQILSWVPEARGLLLGSAEERPLTSELAAACDHERVWNLAGELPLRRLFALLTLCHSGVSLDSGPAHAASTLGCPLVVLNGQADPRRNLPVGPQTRVQSVTAAAEEHWPGTRVEWEAWHQLSGIRLDAVLTAWQRLEHRSLG